MAEANRIEHPLIAVNGLMLLEPRPGLRLDLRYADAIWKAGGIPLAIPPCGGPKDVARLLAAVDGLLLTGGDDFWTEPLGLGPTHPKAVPVPRAKQEFDLLLARAALHSGLPILGICYGMQLLGVCEGAGLYQHLPEDRPGKQPHAGVDHSISPELGSKLARILRVEEMSVVSRHHQALSALPRPWRIAALDGEGLIEAIEREDHPFALGVQWHPELSEEGSPNDRLFQALVAAAGMAHARHFQPLPSPSR